MQITVVAIMCHALGAISQPVCREEIVVKDDMPMQACFLSQPALAEWKEHSIFRGEQWTISGISAYLATTRPRIERDFCEDQPLPGPNGFVRLIRALLCSKTIITLRLGNSSDCVAVAAPSIGLSSRDGSYTARVPVAPPVMVTDSAAMVVR